jgi:hypothetical protein
MSSASAKRPPELLILNTIGLTGAEVLAAALARLQSVYVLPGHNFIEDSRLLYRAHSYTGRSAEDTFDNLALHQYTTGGRCWAGLTKHMNEAQKARYDQRRHRQIFVERVGDSREFSDVVTAYIASFFASMNIDSTGARYLAFYGPNSVLAYHDDLAARRIKVINWHNRIDLWLAMIGQRMTWDNLAACRFWLVNSLYQRWYGENNPDYLTIDMQEFLGDPLAGMSDICSFLNVPQPAGGPPNPVAALGFVEYNPAFTAGIERDAAMLRAIYADARHFRMAADFALWWKQCLAVPGMNEDLALYRRYWNSTGHTNFDWLGPLEERIIAAAERVYPVADGSNASLEFYHRYHRVNSDNFDAPECRLMHSLGCLEEDVVLPLQPVFLRTVIAYISSVARCGARQAHSYYPLRKGSLYQRLAAPESRRKIAAAGLDEKFAEMETLIDEVEKKIGGSIRPWPG